MSGPPGDDITRWLEEARQGDAEAARLVYAVVYNELRRLAAARTGAGRGTPTLETTALVHEAYLRLSRRAVPFADRRHFFATAATVMRGVVVDHARERAALKRGGSMRRVPDTEPLAWFDASRIDVLDLDEALGALAEVDPRKSALVELRFFIGLGIEEAADILDISKATAERDWLFARAWLRTRLDGRASVP